MWGSKYSEAFFWEEDLVGVWFWSCSVMAWMVKNWRYCYEAVPWVWSLAKTVFQAAVLVFLVYDRWSNPMLAMVSLQKKWTVWSVWRFSPDSSMNVFWVRQQVLWHVILWVESCTFSTSVFVSFLIFKPSSGNKLLVNTVSDADVSVCPWGCFSAIAMAAIHANLVIAWTDASRLQQFFVVAFCLRVLSGI